MSNNAKRFYGHLDRQQVLVLGELRIRPDGSGYVEFELDPCKRVEVTRNLGIAARAAYGGIDDDYEKRRCGQCAKHGWVCDRETRDEACEFFVEIPDGEEKPTLCKGCPIVAFDDDICSRHCPETDEYVYPCTLACEMHPEHPEHEEEGGAV